MCSLPFKVKNSKGIQGMATSLMRYIGIEALLAARKSQGLRNDPKVNSKNFPPQPGEVGEKLLDWKLWNSVQDGQFQYPLQIVRQMAGEGYRPATVQELIQYANDNPSLEMKVVELGQEWFDDEVWHVYVWGAVAIDGYGGGIHTCQLLGVKEVS